MSANNSESCQLNKFNDIYIEGFTHAVYANTQIRLNYFNNCVFTKLYRGLTLGESATGALTTTDSISGTSVIAFGQYQNISVTTVSGTGSGAIVTVNKTGTGTSYTSNNTTITIISPGLGYKSGDQLKVSGISLGGTTPTNDLSFVVSGIGPLQNIISNSVFDTITSYGILVDKGTGNRSRGNTFVNVGGPIGSNTSGQIKFTVSGNSSLHDIFDRQASLERINTSLDYLPEVEGYGLRQEQAVNTVLLTSTNGLGALALRLPLNAASGFAIDYVFKSTAFTQMRQGTMYAAVDRANNTVQFTDEYEYTGTNNQDERLQFTASVFIQPSGTKELRINYVNLNVADTNTFTYTTRSIS